MKFIPISQVLCVMNFGNSGGMAHRLARDINPGKNMTASSVSAIGPVHIRIFDYLFYD
jgi:hypothetical protein